MATNLDFGFDGDEMSQEFSGILLEDFNASEGFDYGTGQLELETSALDASASSIPSWLLPSTSSYSYTQPSLPYNDTPTVPSTTTAHANPSMVKPMLPPSKATARPAPREHSAEEWERQRINFTQLYTTEDKPLKEVMKIMENEYGFRATPRQYKRRIEQWKLDKNIKENDMRVILRKDLKRKREGKNSEFRISGREIDPKKIQRFAQRYKVTEESILESNVETPCYIDCDTPAPIVEDEDIQHHVVEEVKIPDSIILSPPAVESDQDREIRIVDTRKTVLNEFIRKFGAAIPIDSTFDLSVFKYPLEIDDLSLMKNLRKSIFHQRAASVTVGLTALKLDGPKSTVCLAGIAIFHWRGYIKFHEVFFYSHSIFLRRSNLQLIGYWDRPFDYCRSKRVSGIEEFPQFDLFLPHPLQIQSFVEFLNFDRHMLQATVQLIRSLDEDFFVTRKLSIDAWDNFVKTTEKELKDLDDLDRIGPLGEFELYGVETGNEISSLS
ncbi:hypothetical protein BELL_1186g00020 [Botrytis elliptica]|uniref:Clr5 domain-containing protein n=1 Tax=Botrytis elliptica TaxID=278938 RepID=A0A4Z1IJY8_9HELO|nr:hypothetical protein BELL_1186g00020 [Botrytis elliptica]